MRQKQLFLQIIVVEGRQKVGIIDRRRLRRSFCQDSKIKVGARCLGLSVLSECMGGLTPEKYFKKFYFKENLF